MRPLPALVEPDKAIPSKGTGMRSFPDPSDAKNMHTGLSKEGQSSLSRPCHAWSLTLINLKPLRVPSRPSPRPTMQARYSGALAQAGRRATLEYSAGDHSATLSNPATHQTGRRAYMLSSHATHAAQSGARLFRRLMDRASVRRTHIRIKRTAKQKRRVNQRKYR